MSPFWGSLFEHLRGCGRNATLFMAALAAFFLVPALAAVVWESPLREYLWPVPALLAVGALIWIVMAIRQLRARRRDGLGRELLSDNERHIALGKLQKPRAQSISVKPAASVKLPPTAPF